MPIVLKRGGEILKPSDFSALKINHIGPDNRIKFDQTIKDERSDNRGAEFIRECDEGVKSYSCFDSAVGAYLLKVTSIAPTNTAETNSTNDGLKITNVLSVRRTPQKPVKQTMTPEKKKATAELNPTTRLTRPEIPAIQPTQPPTTATTMKTPTTPKAAWAAANPPAPTPKAASTFSPESPH